MKQYKIKWGIFCALLIPSLGNAQRFILSGIDSLSKVVVDTAIISSTLLLCWLLNHHFLRYKFRIKIFNNPVVIGVMCVLVTFGIIYSVNIFCVYGLRHPGFISGERLTEAQKTMIIFYKSILASVFCYFIVYYQYSAELLQVSRLENEKLKRTQLHAELVSLQEQVSPHFLFNSLSTLNSIATDQNTKDYVAQLANVYRYLLNFHKSHLVAIHDELAFLNSYLYILQERFEEAFLVEIEISKDCQDLYVPPLAMQILIENAVKHNIISTEDPLKIRIFNIDSTSIVVENNYQPKLTVEGSNGQGLKNITDRYQLLAGKNITIQQTETNYTVILPLLLGNEYTNH